MRRVLIAAGLAATAVVLGSCAPPPEDPPPNEITVTPQHQVLGLDIRYIDRDGHARVLRVEDFPR